MGTESRRAGSLPAPRVPDSLRGPRSRLPPIREPAFWAVQALTLAIAVVHTLLENDGPYAFPTALYLVPSSLFFAPVIYAAVKFGLRGAIPTAAWVIVVTTPNVLAHPGLEGVGELWQGLILLAVGSFAGRMVEHERNAREDAEHREAARLASERRYQALYERVADAVLVVDDEERIEEANAAASLLLGLDIDGMRGRTLGRIVGSTLAADLRSGDVDAPPRLLPKRDDAPPAWVKSVGSSPLTGAGEGGGFQVMFRDVTLQHEREQGLEGYARHAIAAREEERRRLAQELHDGPVQSLMLLARMLDVLDVEDEGEVRDAAVDDGLLDDARETIDETAAELRRISRALRPPILDDLGLEAALRSETMALARRSGIEARFDVTGTVRPLPADTELLLLRVAQESLHNAERHSSAGTVWTSLSYESTKTRLVVADDGTGIGTIPTTPALLSRGKLGLLGIEERVRLAHGSVWIGDGPNGGTTVSITVPLAGTRTELGPTSEASALPGGRTARAFSAGR